MARSLYPTILCSTLVLAITICLRPGTAQEILNFAQSARGQAPEFRAQAPDGGYGYGGGVAGVQGGAPAGPVFPTGGAFPTGGLPNGPGPNGNMPSMSPGVPGGVLIPGAMTQPMPTGRFETAAGSQGGPVLAPPVQQLTPGTPPAAALASAQIITTVGPEVILACDLMGRYKFYQDAVAANAPQEQLTQIREELVTQIKNLVDMKLLFIDATQKIPADVQKDLETQMNEQFNTTQVKDLMERTKSKTADELDAKLREYGTSLARRRRTFYEQQVGRMWLRQQIKDSEKEIPYTEVLAYYQKHVTDYEFKAQAHWEELVVRFDRFPSKADAYQAIADMGNQVLHGIPFADVARAHSQGATAEKGGLRDWTSKGSLLSTAVDEALFSLPVGGMSQIIEDADSFHILRVVERKDAGRIAFLDAQAGIKKKMKEDLATKATDEYMEKLRNRTQVWTIFDAKPQPTGQAAQGAAPGFATAMASPALADRRTGDFNPAANGMQPGPGYQPNPGYPSGAGYQANQGSGYQPAAGYQPNPGYQPSAMAPQPVGTYGPNGQLIPR